VTARFHELFGQPPALYRAPGRVNLIGEHTDYNEGFVMPVALDLSCWVAAAPRTDRRLVVRSENAAETVTVDLERPVARTGQWIDYVAGVATMMRTLGEVRGGNLLIHSEVPAGAGLSSSAALEVASALAIADISGLTLERTAIATLSQRAENEVVGARVGIMDQYNAVHARAGTALVLDCRALEHRHIPLPPGVRIVACNSMVRHSIAGGEYNKRRQECNEAVRTLQRSFPDVSSLRDVDMPRLEGARSALGDLLYRRARHIVTENERVLAAARALEMQDLDSLGRLMAESHRSLRDDYDVTVRELDTLVEAASDVPGVLGARMTGGGFGGCTVNLVDERAVDTFCHVVADRYDTATGLKPDIYVSEPADAGGRVDAW
jgi:galactokinase